MSGSAGKSRGSKRRSEAVRRRSAAVLGALQTGPAAPPRARVAHVTAHAAYVLGSRDAAVRWLTRPNRVLQGEVPMALLASDAGAREVLELLDQVLYGIVS